MNDNSLITRNQSLSIRGVAMLLIYFTHSINEYEAYNSLTSSIIMIPEWGKFACGVFFFVSGYGIYISDKYRDERPSDKLRSRLKRLLIPYLTTYIITIITLFVLLHLCEDTEGSIHIGAILTLGMSDGNELWFLKVIVVNYVAVYVLSKIKCNDTIKILILAFIHIAVAMVLYHNGVGNYWYVSNLCFPLGMLTGRYYEEVCKNWTSILLLGILVFFSYCGMRIFHLHIVVMEVLVCLSVCIMAVSVVRVFPNFWENNGFLIYVGKNSIWYYLLEIPIMWAVPSEDIGWGTYFVVCFVLNSLFVLLGNRIVHLAPRFLKAFTSH